jgi:guanosine-3',5'-bis(diphosphate) 3'-pyrophosphohydrolase
VAELVDGVTKLDKLKFRDRQEAAAESFRKMLLAMSRDLRVIMIKLADRLHNMRTLGAQSREARGRIARETLEIYAPIAQRLGMSLVKSELQNLGFKALYPWRHAIIEKHIRSQPVVRREAMAQVEVQLSQRLAKEGIEHRLISRIKTPWSIYNKMRDENKSFDQVMDVFGFRLVVRSVPSCYHALGSVHATFKPLDGRFRDFIAIPKANGYQSLHTVLFGPYGSPIEVQIRTEEMDLIAERGVAAHWTYKFGGDSPNSAQSRAHAWIVELIDSQRAAGSSLEFLDNVKVDLFPDEVYLFTPKGKILALPRNSTALDFAYAVHTDVGNMAVASRVDKKLVPLRTKLVSGSRWRSSPHARPRRNRSGWNSWSPARRAPPSATSSSSWSTRMPCSWATACSTVRWKRWIRRWSGCRRGAWMRSWPSTVSRAWRRCWPRSRWATGCRPRPRRR